MNNYQRIFGVITIVAVFFSTGLVFAAPDLVIKDYTFISHQKVSETEIDFTYQVNIVNNGTDAQNVTASLTTTAPATAVIYGSLAFGDVAANETKTGEDTITISRFWQVVPDTIPQELIVPDESLFKWDIKYDHIIDYEGGVVDGDDGVFVDIPPAALGEPANVIVELIQESDLKIETPDACQFVGGAKLNIGDAIVNGHAAMSIPRLPGIPLDAEVHVAKVVEYAGTQMYMLQGTAIVEDGAIISKGYASPRKMTSGTYSFLRGQIHGWVKGAVTRKSDGSRVEGAVVTLNGGTWLDITDSNGRFRLPASAGNLVVVASDKWTAEHGEKQGRMPSNDSTAIVYVQIDQNSGTVQDELINGNSETGNLSPWASAGRASVVQSFGPITPDEGNYMAKISNGAGAGGLSSSIEQTFSIPASATTLTFRYNLIVEKYLGSVDRQYNNVFSATLHTSDGSREVAFEGDDSANFQIVSGVQCSSGNCSWGQTGWRTASLNVAQWAGKDATLTLTVHNAGSTAHGATGLVDAIEFAEEYAALETWDLLVVCKKGVNPSVKEWNSLRDNFKRASNFLYDSTDGQVRLGTIKFREYNLIDHFFADVVLTRDYAAALVLPLGLGYIELGSSLIPDNGDHAYGTIVHELGHYKFGLGDEYIGFVFDNSMYCRSTERHGSLMDVPFNHSFDVRGNSEFCTLAGPNSHHDPRDLSTGQPAASSQDGLWGWLGEYTSCWEVINRYNNSIRIPEGDPGPGPCSKSDDPNSNDSHEPLEAHQGTAQFVVVVGPKPL